MVTRYRDGAWITPGLLRIAPSFTILVTLAALAFLVSTLHGTLDYAGRPFGSDFSGVYSAGRMVLEGPAAAVYDWGLHHAAQIALHGRGDVPFYGWHYPPYFLLLAAPLAGLSYLAAFLVWQASALAAFVAVCLRILPGRTTLLAALGFPAVMVCLMHGHNGFLTAALLGGALLALPTRPVLAGILFGCLCYKPQFALLVPVALLASRSWAALLSAALAIAALTFLTLALWGTDVWSAFLASGHLTRTVILEQGATGWEKIGSVFSWARMLGAGLGPAYAVQGMLAAALVASLAWLWAGPQDEDRSAFLMIASLLATPYVLDYDLVVLGPALAFLVRRGLRDGFAPWERSLLALAWFMPLATRALGLVAPVQLSVVVLALLAWVIIRRAAATRRLATAPSASSPA